MTEARPAGHGFTAACFRKKTGIAQMSVIRRTCSGTVGDFHGAKIAASSTTELRRVPRESPGASAKKWFGGMKRRSNGADWTMPTIQKECRQILKSIY